MPQLHQIYDTEERRAKKLGHVRELLTHASRAATPGEADVFQAKADEMMAKYAIESFEVQGHSDTHRRPDPVSRPVDITFYWDHSHGTDLFMLMFSVARHNRCTIVNWVPAEREGGLDARTGERSPARYTIPVVGFPADLDYFDMLFTHLMLQMEQNLEPKPDPKKSMEENLAMMKEAGMKWQRIADLLAEAGQLPNHTPGGPVHRLGLSSVYTRFCEQTGRKRLRVTPSVYQRSFVEGFLAVVDDRFRKQRQLKDEKPTDAKYAPGMDKGASLVLRDIAVVVREKAEELFPKPARRGRGRRGRIDTRKRDGSATAAGMEAGAKADLSGAKPRDRVSGKRGELTP